MGLLQFILDNTYGFAKNVVTTTHSTLKDPTYNEIKGLIETVPLPFINVINATEHWLGEGLKLLDKVEEPIIAIAGKVREKIGSLLEYSWEHRNVPIGYAIDQMAAPIVKSTAGIVSTLGASQQFLEGKLGDKSYADAKAEIAGQVNAWGDGMIRPKPEPSPDEVLIAREKADHDKYSKLIDVERHSKDYEAPETDLWITSGLLTAVNQYRTGAALSSVSWNKDLGAAALKRSFFVADNGKADTAPLLYLRYPPLEKGEEESDADYLQRCREVDMKRKNCGYDEYEVTLDLSDGEYPVEYENNPEMLLDSLLEKHPQLKLVLGNRDMRQMGIGVSRLGTKVSFCFFLVNDAEATEIEEMPAEQPSDWWFERIPEEKRSRGSDIWKIYHGAPGSHAFHSGYAVYQYYLLQKRVEELRSEGKNIRIVSTSYVPKEFDLKVKYDLLHIKIEIAGEVQEVSLVRGTDIVGTREEIQKTSGRGEATALAGMQYMRLSDYMAQISVPPTMKRYPLTGEEERAPGRRAAPPMAPPDDEPIVPGLE